MSQPFIQANTNGRLHSAAEPSISPLNRGFLYGDAVYEVWRTYHGRVFAWDEHFDRLERSAEALHLQLPWPRTQILHEIRRTADSYRRTADFSGDLYIRLQVSRGAGAIGLDIALADQAEFVILVQPCPETSPEVLRQGVRLSLAATLRRNPILSLDPAWKTGNYLNNILCLREARARGADDVVMLNLAGEITEAATSNIGFVRGGEIVTPPGEAGILRGITRDRLLNTIAPGLGLKTVVDTVRPDELAGLRECFLLSTTKDILPVRSIDAWTFDVRTDSVTARLKAAFAEYTRHYAESHPDLAV